jgi:hypothetical protein
MAIDVLPIPSTSGGGSTSPFDAPFQYNFSSETKGSTVTLDLTNTVSAGSYTFRGVAEPYYAPNYVQLLDSTNTVVGSGSLSKTNGSLGTTNSATYLGSVTASSAFSKIKFYNSTGQQVMFSSTVPTTPNYHIIISSGSRTEATSLFLTKLLSDSNATAFTTTSTSAPAGTPFLEWVFNNKYYVMTQSITGNPTGSTNTIRIYAWDFSTNSWSSALASTNPSTIGMNSYATFYNGSNSYWIFKNGKIMIYNHYMYNTSNSGTPVQANRAWTFDMNTNSLSSHIPSSVSMLTYGCGSYNPTNDEWYHLPDRGSFGNGGYYITRIKNDMTTENMGISNNVYQTYGFVMAENSANPKIAAAWIAQGNNYWVGGEVASWSNGNTFPTSINITYSTNPNNYAYTEGVGQINGVVSTIFGQSAWIGVSRSKDFNFYTSPSVSTSSTLYSRNTASYFGSGSNSGYWNHIQPINSTSHGYVRYLSLVESSGAVGGNVVPFPTSITMP